MGGFRLDRLMEFLTSTELVIGLLWAGLAVLTVTLIVLLHTRWGQSKPLRKCIVLSMLAHLLLAGYATTVQIVSDSGLAEEPSVRVVFVEGTEREAAGEEDPLSDLQPWEEFPMEQVADPDLTDPQRPEPEQLPEPTRQNRETVSHLPPDLSLDHLALDGPSPPETEPLPAEDQKTPSLPGKSAEAIDVPPAQRRQTSNQTLPLPVAPGRVVAEEETAQRPNRAPGAGIPSALLQQSPLPKLASEVTTPDPADALSDLVDLQSHPKRSNPAAPTARADDAASDPSSTASGGIEQPGDQPPSASLAAKTKLVPIPQMPSRTDAEIARSVPNIYSLRVAPDRAKIAERQGATEATEAAVEAALKWLANNQSLDGRWDAAGHGGGREMFIAGRNRRSAGMEADSGMTGLTLLAFLASGHTHKEGQYREPVRRGLEYLLRTQAADGNLAGEATSFARMYCHAMAAFALSESYAMTGDKRLERAVRQAVAYTRALQEPNSGGWRYRPGEPGDTSQCGWQLMALKSADLAGVTMPVETRNNVIRYLRTVASGSHGGLASYRPGEQVTRPMTAEALVCWQFLGIPREHPAGNEAGDYLLGELPGQGKPNYYYWYYATLGTYQLQGEHWQRWNEALRKTLVSSQGQSGAEAGSWDPDSVWGGYGGRIYSTALATLCLEVYYRFLPLYGGNGKQEPNSKPPM